MKPALAALVAASLGGACVAVDEDAVTQELTTESAACKVVYEATAWDGGLSASVTITNKGAGRSGWTLTWDWPSGQRITTAWNASASQDGARVIATAASWNGALPPGGSVSFGFNAAFAGTNTPPTEFRLDGASCGTGGGTGGGGGGGDGDGGGDGGGGGDGDGNGDGGGGGGGGTCTAPAWQAGAWYVAGDVVLYAGQRYIAEHDNPGYDPTISTWFWDPYPCNGGDGGGGGGGGGTGFASLVSASAFDAMFPARNPFYTHAGLVAAAATYPAFAGTGDDATRRREAAAFLANMAHETGDLVYIEEIAQGEYCASTPACPCAPGKRYFGRGPIQLSWNYNYCAAGAALGLPLREDPDLVARDPTVAWQTALWFWMTQTGAGTRTAHRAMVDGVGFGETIRTINGAIECGGGNPAAVHSRIDDYRRFTDLLGVPAGANLGC